MLLRSLLPLALLLSLPFLAQAAPPALVEGVAMPAWLERASARQPLKPGAELRAGDRLQTGNGARVLMRLSDGSTVKLGEGATFTLATIRHDPGPAGQQAGDFLSAALDVARGAFRFTTAQLGKIRKREVQIRISGLVAGIRGTDVWGKAFDDRNLLCLIEGRVDVQDDKKLFTMTDPLSFYLARKDGTADPVSAVDPRQLAEWARETEIEPGQGAARTGGPWKLTLASPASEKEALALHDRLRTGGYAAEIQPVKIRGKQHYRVRLTQLPSREEALALAGRIQGKFAPEKPWASLQ